jgi:hypothetical protein
VRSGLVRVRGLAWRLAIPAACLAVAGQLAVSGTAAATHTVAAAHSTAGTITPNKMHNLLDCNLTVLRRLCTDPRGKIESNGERYRFIDHGQYVGHDEPSVKFISSVAGSAFHMDYGMQLPTDPSTAPTSNGSVTDYAELSPAPWFGLPVCDARSYPQNNCAGDSDTNSGSITNPAAAGSAFMELQFYPPGFTPFLDAVSCSLTQWCAALTIDSFECTFNFASCNNNCIEPVNFSFLQTNGVPPGPPAPQDPNTKTFLGNSQTLKMNPGDVLKVAISDPTNGLKAKVTDLTTGQIGFIQASNANGFANTSISDCSGHSHTFHAEYSSARKSHQVPWAALEGGVLMEQEIGHFEACDTVSNQLGVSVKFNDGSTFSDPSVFQSCGGGSEGASATGEGPCQTAKPFTCTGATTQGATGPAACPKTSFTSGALCEFSDADCMPAGSRTVTVNGIAKTRMFPVAGCLDNAFQNGDLDFEGTSYQADWPNGSPNFPTTFRYIGPFTNGGGYPSVQFETDVAGTENLCNVTTGTGCTAPPTGAAFYPFWSMNNTQTVGSLSPTPGACVWNFGNDIAGVTTQDFGRDAQYGTDDIARFGTTLTSPVTANPEFATGCKSITPF